MRTLSAIMSKNGRNAAPEVLQLMANLIASTTAGSTLMVTCILERGNFGHGNWRTMEKHNDGVRTLTPQNNRATVIYSIATECQSERCTTQGNRARHRAAVTHETRITQEVSMQQTIQRWGNSQGIRIPRAVLEMAGMFIGDRVELIAASNEILVHKVVAASDIERTPRSVLRLFGRRDSSQLRARG